MENNQYAGLRRHSTEVNQMVRECLQTALLSLMKEKSYRDISVSELCRKAGVSRMAFYRNYQVINELVREAAETLNYLVLDAVGSPFGEGTDTGWYERAFCLISDHRADAMILFQESFQAEWMKVVNEMALHDDSFSTEERYQRLSWCGGFENVICVWLNTGMKESPQEMAEYCLAYLPHLAKRNAEDDVEKSEQKNV